jgi:hypothetical protein
MQALDQLAAPGLHKTATAHEALASQGSPLRSYEAEVRVHG